MKSITQPWKKGGPSPNPRGRPRGVKDKRTKISQQLIDATSDIAKKVIEQAKEGDMQAAGLIFGRVLPALSSQSERVEFSLDVTAPLAKQTEQVLQAVATGKVSADVAKTIIETLGALGSIRAMEEFENRLTNVERQVA